MAPSPYFFNISICPVDMNVYARFDEIPFMTLKVIKKTKRNGRTDGRTDRQREKQYTLPQTQFAGGIIMVLILGDCYPFTMQRSDHLRTCSSIMSAPDVTT